MADEHEDGPAGEAGGAGMAAVPVAELSSAAAGEEEHAGMRAALDGIEAALDEAAATIARMA